MNINSIYHSGESHFYTAVGFVPQLLLALPFAIFLSLYFMAVWVSSRNHKPWPVSRSFSCVIGIFCAIIAVAGPLANHAHVDFTAHMLSHLSLGMLAPLLLAVAAPMTLLLRTLSVPLARRFSKVLKSWPSRLLTNPAVASFLNIGGLWLLYATNLYSLMHKSVLLYLIVHFHVFLAGYLFTVSMIYIEPMRHRTPFLYRAIVLVIALAGYGILSKYIYAHPPDGVSVDEAELGGMLMFYGGDIIDIVIIFILCLHWFRATRPQLKPTPYSNC